MIICKGCTCKRLTRQLIPFQSNINRTITGEACHDKKADDTSCFEPRFLTGGQHVVFCSFISCPSAFSSLDHLKMKICRANRHIADGQECEMRRATISCAFHLTLSFNRDGREFRCIHHITVLSGNSLSWNGYDEFIIRSPEMSFSRETAPSLSVFHVELLQFEVHINHGFLGVATGPCA